MTKWTDEEKNFLKANVGKIPVNQIAIVLCKSERAVKLFCYRNEIPLRPVLLRPHMKLLLEAKFGDIKYFTPDRQWFERTGIGQKRFSQLKHGYDQPTDKEISAVMKSIGMTQEEKLRYIETLQLELPLFPLTKE